MSHQRADLVRRTRFDFLTCADAHGTGIVDDAPPAYSPTANEAPLPQAAGNLRQDSDADDRYAFLGTFDTIFVIDDSGSMCLPSRPEDPSSYDSNTLRGSRWAEIGAALEAITPICTTHDADGIDIFFLNAQESPIHHNITSVSTVRNIFQSVRPHGPTFTGQRLNRILKPRLLECERNLESAKPLNVIVITDGEPQDDVASVLVKVAKKLDKLDAPAWQVGVSHNITMPLMAYSNDA